MNWRAYLLVVSLAIMVASANYKAPLHTDRQLAALADHIASPARSNNRRVRFDHNVGAIINPRGNEIQTITSDSNRDEQPQQETREFLVHFSKSSSGDPESHHGDSQVIIVPQPGWQSQMPEKILSCMDKKKAKLQNNEHVSQKMLETVPGTSQADVSNLSSSSQLGSVSGRVTPVITEKASQFQKRPDLLNLDAHVEDFLLDASMREREPKCSDCTRDFLSGWAKGASGSSAGVHLASSTNQPESQASSRPFHLRQKPPLPVDDGSRTMRLSKMVSTNFNPLNVEDVRMGTKRKALWGDSLSLKLTENGGNVPDWGDERETLPTMSSKGQSPRKFVKDVWVDHPRPEPSGAFSNPSQNAIESTNQGLSTSELQYNLHLSMIQGPSRKDSTAFSSQHHVNNMDMAKGQYEGRLKFDQDLFKGSETFQEQRNFLAEILASIPKPSEGNFLLSMEQLKVASTKLNSLYPKLKSLLKKDHLRKMNEYRSTWNKYWKDEDKIDFSESEKYPFLKSFEFDQVILHIYLILVKEILLILPFKHDQKMDKGLDYPQEMRQAYQSYLTFKRMIQDHQHRLMIGTSTTPFPGAMITSVWGALKEPHKRASVIIWKFVEFWMQQNYTHVWILLRNFTGKGLANNIKSIFSSIFIYGIENMTHQIRVD